MQLLKKRKEKKRALRGQFDVYRSRGVWGANRWRNDIFSISM
jgi:hypothetical protein